ncbi:uncharacterized protein EAE97_011679 [Botrytis byssoidea]|uniref:NYN domain-containing protein n=1 Tax=Botrytis byssoidea TaxID=139641 RepID=A0A9P5HVJ4_9HELO|nr:uncharacterized protein EAE97_011679 [Botrytis byssoidea]KAF7919347.1 hypothetical protein EAE97_011679 [Botrytis byssoidea]
MPSSELTLTNSLDPINPNEALYPPSLTESQSSSPNSKLDSEVGSSSHTDIRRRRMDSPEPKVKTIDPEPEAACPKSDSSLRLDRSEKDTSVPNQGKSLIGKKGYKAQFCKPPHQRGMKSKFKLDQISALADTEAASKDQGNTSISRQTSVVVLWDIDNKRYSPFCDDVVTSLKKFAGNFGELINISAFGSHLTFYGIGTKLVEAGVHIERVGTAPQEADAALQRSWKKWKMKQLEKEPSSFVWLILVSDDAGFRYMLRSGKRSGFGVVIVNEFFTKLSLEGDLRMPWPQLKAGNYSLDGLADHIVGISTMGRRWIRENMNTTDSEDEDPIDKVILKLKIQLKAKNTMKRELLLRTMQKRSILEQRLKRTSEKDLRTLEILEKALRKLEDPSGHKNMRGIDGSILKLETELNARIEAKKTKSLIHEVTPGGDTSDEEFLKNLTHADFVKGLMRLAENSSSSKIDPSS